MGLDGRENPRKSLEEEISVIWEMDGKNRLIIYLATFVLLAVLPHLMPNAYWLRIYGLTGIYVMLSLGLNVVAGFAGLLDLAYVAFFGIGGYAFALLSSSQFNIHLPFLIVLPLAAVVTMGFGFALGATSIRLRGDYLAIATLAFAQIFKLMLINLDQPVNITGGVNGIYGFDVINILGVKIVSPEAYAYLIWFSALVVMVGCLRLKNSRYGRGWNAIREDELAARVLGINATWMKLKAFAGGAFIAGGTGAFFASFQDSVFPNNFDFQQLVIVYCMVILGGLGNIAGIVLGAVLLSILPEFLREYGAYRMMSYGLILILLMALRPQGLLGSIGILTKQKKRPDKDDTGVLRASTDLYYEEGTREAAPDVTGKRKFSRGDRVAMALKGVTMRFGGVTAVMDLDFKLFEREILSIIGPNGAGKSTVFNLVSGIYKPVKGSITYNGEEISGLKPHQVLQVGIARTFQNLRLFNKMTVLDNAKVGQFYGNRSGPLSILFHLPRYKREEAETDRQARKVLGLFGKRLTGYRLDQEAIFLSYANRRRLEIARAISTNAKVLMLDEPSAGMNPQETSEITHFIKELRDVYGYTILLIEHKLNLVRTLSDRVIVLDYGRKIAEGSYETVANSAQVIEAYLGRKGR